MVVVVCLGLWNCVDFYLRSRRNCYLYLHWLNFRLYFFLSSSLFWTLRRVNLLDLSLWSIHLNANLNLIQWLLSLLFLFLFLLLLFLNNFFNRLILNNYLFDWSSLPQIYLSLFPNRVFIFFWWWFLTLIDLIIFSIFFYSFASSWSSSSSSWWLLNLLWFFLLRLNS